MKNIETPDKMHLGKLIDELRYGKFVIPDFQREFTWSPADVKELLHSIFEDYYIGTLLLWRASRDNIASLECEEIYGFKGKLDPVHIVLDGQQRLSALYYAFFAPDKPFPSRKNRLIFTVNLKKLIAEEWNDLVDYEWLTNKVKGFFDNDEKQFENHTFPLYILGEKSKVFYKWLEGYEKYWSVRVGKDQAARDAQKIERFFDDLLANYDISFIELDRNIEVGKVCDIFTRINNTGVRLTIFDLLNALLRPKDIKLKEMYREISEDFKGLPSNNVRVQLLQTMSVLKQGYCAPKYLYYLVPNEKKVIKTPDGGKREIILIKSSEEFLSLWDFTTTKFRETLRAISNGRDFGAIKPKFIPYPTMLPILTALFIEKEKDNYKDKGSIYKKIKKWYWSSIFTKNYSSSVESQIARDYSEMLKWFTDDTLVPRVVTQFENEIENLDLKKETHNTSAVYRAIFNILVIKGAKDWYTFDYPEYSDLEDHHIVPRSWGRKNNLSDVIDSVLNRVPLSEHTNRVVISDKLPNVYIREMFERAKNKDEVYNLLATHLISPKAVDILLRENFTPDDYREFIEERQKTIIKEIRALCGFAEPTVEGLVRPTTPLSNRLHIERLVSQCEDYLHWVDKYFSKVGFEIIINALNDKPDSSLKQVKILTSIDKVDDDIRRYFKYFKKELANYGIQTEMRVMVDNKIKASIHDRWIITNNKTYNIPSPDVIARGQYSEISESHSSLPFDEWWEKSLDIIEDWNKLERLIK